MRERENEWVKTKICIYMSDRVTSLTIFVFSPPFKKYEETDVIKRRYTERTVQ